MNFLEPALLILFLAIISGPIASRFHLPLEVFLVIGSCLVASIPELPTFQLDPQIVFKLFLPPILFYAAYFTSWRDFKINIRPITLLAFGLVAFTMVTIAIIAHFSIPNFTWADGFLLGAIVSPTDASAATAMIRKFYAPKRIITILEGESLINDAAALLFFKFALASILSGGFSLPSALFEFFFITIGGTIIGLVIAFTATQIFKYLNSVSAETTLTLVTAFTCFLVAERLGMSGVISTVVGGIYFGLRLPEVISSRTRISANATWNTLMFIINGFAFTLIGISLPLIYDSIKSYSVITLIVCALLVNIGLIIARLIWVFFIAIVSRILVPSINVKDPMPRWELLFIIGWCGMRGIVSLAAALSIPFTLLDGSPFPHREAFLFVTFCIIVSSLILPSITLPYLLTRFGFSSAESTMKEEAVARVHALKAAHDKIEEMAMNEKFPADILNELRHQIRRRLNVITSQLNPEPYSTLNDEFLAVKKLTLAAIVSERNELIHLRKAGEISDDIFHQLLDELDFEELRSKTLRI